MAMNEIETASLEDLVRNINKHAMFQRIEAFGIDAERGVISIALENGNVILISGAEELGLLTSKEQKNGKHACIN